ncbi:MAG: hypothetical protein IJH95_00440 [Mogibacterium sp.]|nr:hypothetical protein [Mogibacterium sp.]
MGKNSIGRMRQAYKRYLLRYPPYTLWEPIERTDIVNAAEKDDSGDFGA